MQNVYSKHGAEVLAYFVLEEWPEPLTRDALMIAEQKWIDALKPCYNAVPSAKSTLGLKWSESARANGSAGQRKRFESPEECAKAAFGRLGKPSPWKGRTPSEETRAKMRAAKVGKSSTFKGKKHSEEAKRRLSESKRGRPSPKKGTTRSPDANAKQSASMKAMYAARRAQASLQFATG